MSGLDRRTVEKRLLSVTPATTDKRGKLYSIDAFLPALCKEEATDASNAIRDVKLKAAAAEADSAGMDAKERKGRLVIKADAKLVIADMLTQIRKAVEKATYLRPEFRGRLLKDMQKIKIAPIPADEILTSRLTARFN